MAQQKIFQGDSLKVLPQIVRNNSVDFIFVEPPAPERDTRKTPYEGYCKFTKKWIAMGFRKLKDGGVMQILLNNRDTLKAIEIASNYGKLIDTTFWHGALFISRKGYSFQDSSRVILTFVK